MRVIAGTAKGIPLTAPSGLHARPTTDRVKESMFAVIQFEIQGRRVLDLFSGSGALGIEALSRGADFAVFVDNFSASIAAVKENLQKTKLFDRASILQKHFAAAVNTLKGERFDLIFIDPPYAAGFYETALCLIYENGMLSENGTIVAESSEAGSSAWVLPTGLSVYKEKQYGNTVLTYLKKV